MKPFYELDSISKVTRLRKLARENLTNPANEDLKEFLRVYEKDKHKRFFNEELINQAYEKYIKN